MLNINLADNVVVIEPDPVKLDLAIRTALGEAREVLRTHYLAEFRKIPSIEVRISTGKQADNYKNGAHVVYHLLSPPQNVSLLANYIETLDQILSQPGKANEPKEMVSYVVFGVNDIVGRWSKCDHLKTVCSHGLRAFFVSLLRQRAVLLPANLERYLPHEQGGWKGFNLMPERLQHLAAVYYAGSGLEYGVNWDLCNYTMNGVSLKEKGIENLPSKGMKLMLLRLAMCTRWERLEEIDPADIEVLKKLANSFTIGFYLTYLYLKAQDKAPLIRNVFPWVESIPSLRIYVEEYSVYAMRSKARRSSTKRGEAGLIREAGLAARADVDRRSLKERVQDAITEATQNGKVDPILLARSLGRMRNRTHLKPGDNWPQESVLPDHIPFDWVNQSAHWLAGFRLYAKMTEYSDADQEFNNYTSFMHYLTVYLPIYFYENPDSDASYPSRIEGLDGFKFMSRPFEIPFKNLPLPYVDFVREFYREALPMRKNTVVRKLYTFFELILSKGVYLGIPGDFKSPVLLTDIPGTGGRPTKTTKRRLPSKAYWSALLYAYKIYDYVSIINRKCLNDAVFAEQYPVLFRNLEVDELGLFDIRDILDDDEADCVISFQGVEHTANLVPSCFFHPVELPIKQKGNRFVIRPHAIAHLICALETGIRNQHIQWLSYDFDKSIEDLKTEDIDPEKCYELFVMTDKSNKSWTAITAGRVIRVLREIKIFRDQVDAKSFDDKLYYEGRSENSHYPPFKMLFAFNLKTGNPYSNNVYDNGFKSLMSGLQCVLDHYGVEYSVFEIVDHERTYRIRTKLSPHSMRVTVVSVYRQYLTPEEIGHNMTNQTPPTVWYYTVLDAEDLQKMQTEQERGVSQFNRVNSEVRLLGNGGISIDTTNPNSKLAKAFKEDPRQAITDSGAVCSHLFEREGGKTGIDILLNSNGNLNLAFLPTYICPYDRICPEDQKKRNLANRCNYCDYAIRTIEHLPALVCRRRDLAEELDRLDAFIGENSAKLTEGDELDIDAKRSIIAEDLGSLHLIEVILEQNRQRLQRAKRPNCSMFTNRRFS